MNNNLVFIVDEIISETGYYCPVELLLRQGRLRYADYESWRYGDTDTIAEHLMGSAKRINSLLSSARDYILTLQFSPETAEFTGWKGEKLNQLLNFCKSGSDIDITLLSTRYRRPDTAPQLDLFFDNQGVQLANELVQALAGRNVELAEQKLNQLELVDPGHVLCGQGASLLDALQQLDCPPGGFDPEIWLDDIRNNLMPLVKEALPGKMRDFMAPFWRKLAQNLNPDNYSEHRPELHPAYCYSQNLQWPDVIRSIRETMHWQQFPGLYKLYSRACYQNDQRYESLQLLCDYCWKFRELKPDFILDTHSVRQFALYQDLELDDKWGWYYFPAWLILNEPGLTGHLTTDDSQNNTSFMVLSRLLLLQQTENGQNIELRKRLKTEHQGLFDYFMANYGG